MTTMQRLASSPGLQSLNLGIAALCHERVRVQREQSEYRHAPRDARHDKWDAELARIAERRTELVKQQKEILKRSTDCGVPTRPVCI